MATGRELHPHVAAELLIVKSGKCHASNFATATESSIVNDGLCKNRPLLLFTHVATLAIFVCFDCSVTRACYLIAGGRTAGDL